MSLLIGFLTFILVITCLFLMLLVLIQLPKKEAGAGIAFGGGATDALFGAGSGTALTKLTKYTATVFLLLSLGLTVLNTYRSKSSGKQLDAELQKQAGSVPIAVPPMAPPSTSQFMQLQPQTTNLLTTTLTNAPGATNKPATNRPAVIPEVTTNTFPATAPNTK